MSRNNNSQRLEIALEEYRTLKSEQLKRIGFRDSLVYITIGALGTFTSLVGPDNPSVLLAVPLLLVVLGWAYLMNDQKVSAIGRYIREDLYSLVLEEMDPEQRSAEQKDRRLFGWEKAHRSDPRRKSRKALQLIIDLVAFIGPGTACLGFYVLQHKPLDGLQLGIVAFEVVLLVGLWGQILIYADLGVGGQLGRSQKAAP